MAANTSPVMREGVWVVQTHNWATSCYVCVLFRSVLNGAYRETKDSSGTVCCGRRGPIPVQCRHESPRGRSLSLLCRLNVARWHKVAYAHSLVRRALVLDPSSCVCTPRPFYCSSLFFHHFRVPYDHRPGGRVTTHHCLFHGFKLLFFCHGGSTMYCELLSGVCFRNRI